MSRPTRTKRWVWILGALVALAVIALTSSYHASQRSFDPKRWKQTTLPPEHRHRMVADLLRTYGVIGMKRKSVEALLGPPDRQWVTPHRDDDSAFFGIGRRPDGRPYEIDTAIGYRVSEDDDVLGLYFDINGTCVYAVCECLCTSVPMKRLKVLIQGTTYGEGEFPE